MIRLSAAYMCVRDFAHLRPNERRDCLIVSGVEPGVGIFTQGKILAYFQIRQNII